MASDPVRPIYLDHHATTPVDPRVLARMWPWFGEQFGNASSLNHRFGQEAAAAVEQARDQISRLLSAEPRSIVFTSGATESNNLAIKGLLRARGKGAHWITAASEHRAVLDPAKRMMKDGFDVTIVPANPDGGVDPYRIADSITPKTALVSVMLANNEVGTINPIVEIGKICRERGILFHTDATQAVGKIPVDLESSPIDLLSASAHKFYGPKGVGLLFVRRGEPRIRLEPLFDGGGHESHLRSGTLAVPLIVGLGEACRIAREEMQDDSKRIRELRDELQRELYCRISGLVVNGSESNRLAGNLNVSIPGVDGEALMMGLKRIAVSSGSACTTREPEPSHVLRAMGRSDELTRSSLRFGIGKGNTMDDLRVAVTEVVEVVDRLRSERAAKTSNR